MNSESKLQGDDEVEKMFHQKNSAINAQVEHKGENVNSESNTLPDKPEKELILKETCKVH